MTTAPGLDEDLASRFARLALANVVTEYPNKLDHLLQSDADLLAPRTLHPSFYGSYDWHSAVHMHWLLVRLVTLVPQLPERAQLCDCLDAHLAVDAIEGELAYLRRPASQTFERPYGWAWLLKLDLALREAGWSERRANAWAAALAPLTEVFVARFKAYLPKAAHPVRAGSHANSAFALYFALEHARASGDGDFEALIAHKALQWYAADRAYPARYEPSGTDFLSPGLMEAVLLQAVLDEARFARWWRAFAPPPEELGHWLKPVEVPDRNDAQLVHLDGLNLARAWCWRMLAGCLEGAAAHAVEDAIDAHLAASLPAASSGDYVGTHWLASFALLALTAG